MVSSIAVPPAAGHGDPAKPPSKPCSLAVRHRAVLLCLLALVGLLIAIRSASACSCWHPTPEQLIRGTPTIFAGRVVEVRRTPASGGPGGDTVTAIVEVLERWKGDVPDRVEVHSHTDGASCGWGQFPQGERITVFGGPRREGDGVGVGYCSMVPYASSSGERRAAFDAGLSRYRAERERLAAATAVAAGTPAPWLDLGRFLEGWNELDAAALAYAEAARVVPGLALAHAGGGRVLFSAGRLEDAKAPLRRAVELSPSDTESARLLGQARLRTGDLKGLAAADFRRLEMRGLDLSNRDLRGRDFSDAKLEQVRLAGADLRGARLARARISGWMSGADLRNANLEGAAISGDLAGARFDGANLARVELRGDLSGASLRGVAAPDAKLDGAVTAGAAFEGASLPGASFRSGGPFPDPGRYRSASDTDFADARLVGADFRGANLAGSDLSRADLRGARFEGARFDCRTRFPAGFAPSRMSMLSAEQACTGPQDFTGQRMAEPIDFSGLDLRGAVFREAEIAHGFFRGSNLAGADFTRAAVRHTDLLEADLRGARFDFARLRDAKLHSADLSGASFRGARVDLDDLVARGVGHTGARPFEAAHLGFLRHAVVSCGHAHPRFDLGSIQAFVGRPCSDGGYTPFDVRGADLAGFDLTGADLRGFDFTGTDLRGTNLSDADLTGARLDGALLLGARYNARDRGGTRWPAGFDIARKALARGMVRTDLVNDDNVPTWVLRPHELNMAGDTRAMRDAPVPDLSGTVLDGLDLHGAWLRGGRLIGASLRGARLTGANLFGADLSGADLRGADLRNALLEQAVLTGARHDAATRWPARFSPPAAGAPQASARQRARRGLPPRLTVRNCDVAGGYSVSTYARPEPGGPELLVLGIYEIRRGALWPDDAVEGKAAVRVRRTTPHVLVLSSHEPVAWTIRASPGARIERVVLDGVGRQRVRGVPRGVPVVERSGQDALSGSAYEWPGEDGGTRRLVLGLRELTSREVTAFAGCYSASEFTVEDGRRPRPAAPLPPTR